MKKNALILVTLVILFSACDKVPTPMQKKSDQVESPDHQSNPDHK